MFSNGQKKIDKNLVNMPDNQWARFHEILKIQSSSRNESRMMVYLHDLFKGKYHSYIDKTGNLIVTKGKSDCYPCIVSHLDTVHEISDDYNVEYIKRENSIHARALSKGLQVGVGGDDKCGIFSCIEMLAKFDNIKAIFFTKEEVGLVGSGDIELGIFDDVGYVIQLDRWGRGDFISKNFGSSTVSPEFKKKANASMKKFGYHHVEGLITDSINLWERQVGLSCINLSCGYYQHHSNMEFIDLNEFYNSLLFTESIIKELGENKYPCDAPVYSKYGKGLDWNNKYDDWEPEYKKYDSYKYGNTWNGSSWSKSKMPDVQKAGYYKDDYAKENTVEEQRQADIIDNYDIILNEVKQEMKANNIDGNATLYEAEFLVEQLKLVGWELTCNEMFDMIDEIVGSEVK
jgi:hypothetical protein